VNDDRKRITISRLCWLAGIVFIYRARVEYDEQPLYVMFFHISFAFYAFVMAHHPQVFLNPFDFKGVFLNTMPMKGIVVFLSLIAHTSLLLALATRLLGWIPLGING
jgi:membrane glycosyltransferase